MPELLTLEAALEHILEHAKPAPGRDGRHRRRVAGGSCASRRRAHRRPSAVSELGDGRVRRSSGGHAGRAPRGVSRGRRRSACRARSPPAQAARDRHRSAPCPRRPTRSCRSSSSRIAGRSRRDRRRPSPGQHVRPRGGDVHAGDVVVAAGTRLGAAQIGALAAAGIAEVACSTRPRVAVLATGSELRAPGEPLAAGPDLRVESGDDRGRARARRRRGRRAARGRGRRRCAPRRDRARPRGGRARHVRRRLDGPARSRARSRGRARGRGDLLGRCRQAGEAAVVRRFASETLVFGLPGNPVSSLVGALVFVRPALLARQGLGEPGPRYSSGVAAARFAETRTATSSCARSQCRDGDGARLEPIAGQESHMIARAAAADALVHVPRGEGELSRRAAASSATSRSTSEARAATRARVGPAGGGSAPPGVGPVATERERADLGGRRPPHEHEERGAEREIPDREEADDVERRSEDREPELVAQDDEPERRPESPSTKRSARPRAAPRAGARATRRATAGRRRERTGCSDGEHDRDDPERTRARPQGRPGAPRGTACELVRAGDGRRARRAANAQASTQDPPTGRGRRGTT